MAISQFSIEPFFLDFELAPLFCVAIKPVKQPIKSCILYVPPFGDEMHKSRHMVTLQAHELAKNGHFVLILDLFGCGDSYGDSLNMTWATWGKSILFASDWLITKFNVPVNYLALRSGALLLSDLSIPKENKVILWQPIVRGDKYLQHLLRLKAASNMLSNNKQKLQISALLKQLKDNGSIEIGGYLLSEALLNGLSNASLDTQRLQGNISWIEIDQTSKNMSTIKKMQSQGADINHHMIKGDNFWNKQDIHTCPALIKLSVDIFNS